MRVSLLIPVYNARPWIARSIESALAQTWPEKEVIVLDDGSTDGSAEVIASFGARIRWRAVANAGQNASRNRLTAMSAGDWLVYLDADDELAPDCVEQKMRHADQADALYGSVDHATFEGSRRIGSEILEARDHGDPWVAALGWRFPNTSAFAFRREALLAAGGWDESVENCTDYATYIPMLLRGARFKAAARSWSLYRRWSPGTQAASAHPLRLASTQLDLLHRAASALDGAGQLLPARRQAFLDSALAAIRWIYPLDAERALREHARLRPWSDGYAPSAAKFPLRYRVAYRLLGFAAAERLAAAARRAPPA